MTDTILTPALSRRRFLQLTGAGAAALWTQGVLTSARADDSRLVSKDLVVHLRAPLNGGPKLARLVESWLTPPEYFYVRNHAPIPEIDPATFRLKVEGLVERPLALGLDELRERFPQTSVIATLTCAGNRRTEFNAIKQVGGVQWGAGAIGNCEWSGVRLASVLRRAGLKEGAKHVWFEGLDEIVSIDGGPFGGSIPLEKALAGGPVPGALLATEMAKQPLPAQHGAPLRVVVPGYIGARSVKWLGRIVVSDKPSPNHYLTHAYKLVTEATEPAWEAAEPLYEYPVNSVICTPEPGARRRRDNVLVQGYAIPHGSGSRIRRVELSSDGGATWRRARLVGPAQEYCWRLWQARVPFGERETTIAVRATDSDDRTQPATIDWNYKGYFYNAWHRVTVSKQG